jgi:hypothetical protein
LPALMQTCTESRSWKSSIGVLQEYEEIAVLHS